MKFFTVYIIFFLYCVLDTQALGLSPEVTLPLGKVSGYFTETVNGKQISAFEGIPYAKPPIGKHRFKESVPLTKPWLGIWNASTLYKCMQYNHYTDPGDDYVIGNEDCLYLNVYTPDLQSNTLMDVIIFIHGGAFMFNHGGSYGHKIILDKNVVYVSLNYRLGPLGFLSTEDGVVPGNMGLKDQLLALKWIKTNIAFFRGNPNSITVTGMSAGGASSQFHSISPLSRGLLNRGISQSGTVLNPWVIAENSLGKTKELAAYLGCPSTTTREMIECLRSRSAYQITHAVKIFQPWLYNPFSPFGVVVDKWAREPFLPEHPYQMLRSGQVQDVPWIFSAVESEGLYPGADFIADPQYLKDINYRWNELMPHVLDFNYTIEPSNILTALEKIREFYFDEQIVSKSTYSSLIKLLSDRLFLVDIDRATRLHATTISSPVYYYHFAYRGKHSKSELRSHSNEDLGAAHGDDTVYVLSGNVNTLETENDRKMSEILCEMWLSFASTNVPKVANIEWSPVSKDVKQPLSILLIGSPTNITNQLIPSLGNRNFWDSLPLKENKNLFVLRDEL